MKDGMKRGETCAIRSSLGALVKEGIREKSMFVLLCSVKGASASREVD
jgi:hypothetical protein